MQTVIERLEQIGQDPFTQDLIFRMLASNDHGYGSIVKAGWHRTLCRLVHRVKLNLSSWGKVFKALDALNKSGHSKIEDHGDHKDQFDQTHEDDDDKEEGGGGGDWDWRGCDEILFRPETNECTLHSTGAISARSLKAFVKFRVSYFKQKWARSLKEANDWGILHTSVLRNESPGQARHGEHEVRWYHLVSDFWWPFASHSRQLKSCKAGKAPPNLVDTGAHTHHTLSHTNKETNGSGIDFQEEKTEPCETPSWLFLAL